jgi:Protein of unknown function (DUF2716)
MNAWIALSEREEDEAWERVKLRLRFRSSVSSGEWPGILEPRPFKTFSVAHFWETADKERLHDDLESKAAALFQACTDAETRLYALDWQHECYWLRPHHLTSGERWIVPAFPDGDYYMFLSQDLDFGWFGHPWEQSICVSVRHCYGCSKATGRNSSPK